MSIIIKGMKMPKDGECIVVSSYGTAYKYERGDVVMYGDGYKENKDAIELPPHGRLIDADAFLEKLKQDPLFPLVEKYGMSGVIEAQHTIIEAEGSDTDGAKDAKIQTGGC